MKTIVAAILALTTAGWALDNTKDVNQSGTQQEVNQQDANQTDSQYKQESGKAGSEALRDAMNQSSKDTKAMKLTGDVDLDFVKAMIKHHQHGIEMAQIQVRDGKDDKAKDFAQNMIDEEKKEIKELENWLDKYGEKKSKQQPDVRR